MKKVIISLIFSYIVLQLAVTAFKFRSWPLNDYPMYGAAISKFDSVHIYKLKAILKNGESFWLPRSFSFSYGSFESTVRDSYGESDYTNLKKSLMRIFNHRGGKYLNVKEVHLFKKQASRVNNSHKFEINHELIFKIPF